MAAASHARTAAPTLATRTRSAYAEFAPTLLGDALQTGELRGPEDGAIPFTTHADLAEATAVALTDDGLDEETLALTALEAVELTDIAAITSKLADRPIRRVVRRSRAS